MILGMDLMLGSIVGVLCTFLVAVPSVVYRAGIEDQLLRKKFGEKWEDYANRTGLLLPRLRRGKVETELDANATITDSSHMP
jgi:protein-S-isoprenylcysteine O-methyltransferase Ste14